MNIVEFVVKIKDMASGPLQKLGGTGTSAFSKMESAMSRVTGKWGLLKSNLTQIDAKIASLERTRSVSLDGSQVSRINRELKGLQAQKDRLEGRSSGGLHGVLGAGLLFGGVGLATMLGGNMLKNGMDRQMAGSAFEVMAGKGPGDKLHGNLMRFATDTIYGNEVFGEAKTMLSFGVAANNIMPAMRMIGDVAMGDVEHMKSLSLVFAQSASAGKLMGQDLLQYVNAGFNPLQALSEKTGKSMAVLRKETEQGKISFKDIVSAFEYATGPMGRFYNGMKKMGETPTGKWIAFKGALETLSGTIGLRLLPALGHIADFLTGLIGNEQLLYNIAAAIGAMTAAWLLYTAWTERAAIATYALEAAAYWPLALVGLIGYAYADLNKYNTDYAKNTKDTANSIADSFTFIRRCFETLIYWIENGWLRLTTVYQGMIDVTAGLQQGNLSRVMKGLTGDNGEAEKLHALQLRRKFHLANDYANQNDDGTPKSSSLLAKLGNGLTPGGTTPGTVDDGTKAITGGGVRSITINVAKFQDKTEIHTATLKESVAETEEMIRNMFLRIVNSGAPALE